MKAARTAPKQKHVLVMGVEYASLAWYLGSCNPTPKQVAIVKRECSEWRLELDNGDTKTLERQGFAHEANPKELEILRICPKLVGHKDCFLWCSKTTKTP